MPTQEPGHEAPVWHQRTPPPPGGQAAEAPLDLRPPWLREPGGGVQPGATAEGAAPLFNHFTDGPTAGARPPQPAAQAQEPGAPQAAPAQNPAAGGGGQGTLTDEIARTIAIHETNRGGNEPRPRESDLDTTAGVKASVRSVSQATMPWILGALNHHPELRQNASQPVTPEQIQQAEHRVHGTDRLLGEVDGAGQMTPEQFAAEHAEELQATGMTQADVTRMFQGRDLHAKVKAAHARLMALPKKQRRAALQRELGAIPEDERAGLGSSSLGTYIKDPRNWGENRAGWERLSVSRMPNGVGQNIEDTATHNEGLTMMGAVMNSQVAAQQRLHPHDTDAVVKGVAHQHNAHADYPGGVLREYHRLYPHAGAATAHDPEHPQDPRDPQHPQR
jgi:hypothetical protein